MPLRTSARRVRLAALLVLALPLVAAGENRSKFNAVVAPGDEAPNFEDLPGADGKTHSLADYKDAKVIVVCFSSTLCNVVTLYEDRFVDLAKEYGPKGVSFVAISCERRSGAAGELGSAEDAGELERIRERAKAESLPFDYLYDGTQKVARAYGARSTPSFFVLDGKRKIAYLGGFDDKFPAEAVMEHYVRDAVDAVLAGKSPEVDATLARGCRIDYVD